METIKVLGGLNCFHFKLDFGDLMNFQVKLSEFVFYNTFDRGINDNITSYTLSTNNNNTTRIISNFNHLEDFINLNSINKTINNQILNIVNKNQIINLNCKYLSLKTSSKYHNVKIIDQIILSNNKTSYPDLKINIPLGNQTDLSFVLFVTNLFILAGFVLILKKIMKTK